MKVDGSSRAAVWVETCSFPARWLVMADHESLNALNPRRIDAIRDAVASVAQDPDARVLLLRSEARAFCAGGDLRYASELQSLPPEERDQQLQAFVEALQAMISELRALPMATISVVEGAAAGAGMGLALSTDFMVMARSARLIPAFAQLGATPDSGASFFLARALGRQRALRLLLRGEDVSAEQAERLGLAEPVAPDGEAVPAALALAQELAELDPSVVVGVRGLLDRASEQDLGRHLRDEAATVATLYGSATLRHRVQRFDGTVGQDQDRARTQDR